MSSAPKHFPQRWPATTLAAPQRALSVLSSDCGAHSAYERCATVVDPLPFVLRPPNGFGPVGQNKDHIISYQSQFPEELVIGRGYGHPWSPRFPNLSLHITCGVY